MRASGRMEVRASSLFPLSENKKNCIEFVSDISENLIFCNWIKVLFLFLSQRHSVTTTALIHLYMINAIQDILGPLRIINDGYTPFSFYIFVPLLTFDFLESQVFEKEVLRFGWDSPVLSRKFSIF